MGETRGDEHTVYFGPQLIAHPDGSYEWIELTEEESLEEDRKQALRFAERVADEYRRQTGDSLNIPILVEALGSARPEPTGEK